MQRVYRGYYARVQIFSANEVARVNEAARVRLQTTQTSSSWWLERDIPHHLPPIKTFGRKRDHLSG